jgi:hypothetical protein
MIRMAKRYDVAGIRRLYCLTGRPRRGAVCCAEYFMGAFVGCAHAQHAIGITASDPAEARRSGRIHSRARLHGRRDSGTAPLTLTQR